MEVRHAYKYKRKRVQIDTGTESRVRQSEHEGTKIDNILKRYAATGILPVQQRQPIFADVSELTDYKEALDKIHAMGDVIKTLPKEARDLLLSNPAEFEKMIAADTTRENLEAIGLIAKKEEVPDVVEPDSGDSGGETPPDPPAQ